MTAAPLRLGIAGLGTVGVGVVKMIQKNAALLTQRAGRETWIFVKKIGNDYLYDLMPGK